MKPELLQLIDRLRSLPHRLEADAPVREIETHGLVLTEEDFREIVRRYDSGGFIPPTGVVDFVMRFVAERKISTALDFGCGVVGFVGKPCAAKIAHTSLPDNTRSLPKCDLHAGHVDFGGQPAADFRRGCTFKEKSDGPGEIAPRLFHGVPLVGDVEFRAERT